MSRSLVGSSSSSTLPPCFRVSARLSRLRSPPENRRAGFCWSEPLKPNAATIRPGRHLHRPMLQHIVSTGHDFPRGAVGVDVGAVLVDVGDPHRLTDSDRARVGCLVAGEQLEQGGLADPVRADRHRRFRCAATRRTDRRTARDRRTPWSGVRPRSPDCPAAGPGGMRISSKSRRRVFAAAAAISS